MAGLAAVGILRAPRSPLALLRPSKLDILHADPVCAFARQMNLLTGTCPSNLYGYLSFPCISQILPVYYCHE